MSRWRPVEKNCIYIIGDIHGNLELLENVCKRILPLRKSDGGKDQLVFLGDYIDRHVDSHKVIDYLLKLRKKYPKQITFLLGNHELMLMQALNIEPGVNHSLQSMSHSYKMWLDNGGRSTVAGYRLRKGHPPEDVGFDLPRSQVLGLFPQEHLEFFKSLKKGYEYENYIFVHGGCNPTEPLYNQDHEVLTWDRSLVKFVQAQIQLGQKKMPWEKTVICGHSVQPDKLPVIADNFMMIDCGSPKQLLVMEVRSKTAYMAYPGQTRLVKFDLTGKQKSQAVFIRVTDAK